MTAATPGQPERDHAEWLKWAEANGYANEYERDFHHDDMRHTFIGGMNAARAAVAAQPVVQVTTGSTNEPYGQLAAPQDIPVTIAAQDARPAPGDSDRLIDWAAKLIADAKRVGVDSESWHNERQDWLSTYKATPRGRPAPGLAAAMADLADELDREAKLDSELSETRDDGLASLLLVKRAESVRRIADRIRERAGLPS